MLASLAMYDLPEARAATAAWWQGLSRAFRAEGIADVPDQLTASPEYPAHWLRPDLLFGQTCGYPLTHVLAGKVRLVATPGYTARGCSGSSYCSLLIVAEDSPAATLEDLRGARCAFNGPESQSGYNVLRAMVAPLARPGKQGGRFFGATIETGSHRASIAAVGQGHADLCAVDCVTHAMLARHTPTALAGTRVLCESPSAPGLPFVTAGAAGDDLVARLQAGLARAIADPSLAAARDDLLITGAEVLPFAAYDVILEMETIGKSFELSQVMKCVILIGTSHDYQLPGRPGSDEFRARIERLCRDNDVCAIAEECSQEALIDAVESMCKQTANALGISHRYCDPDRTQRQELGILQENDIKIRAWWSADGGVNIDQELRSSHSKREHYWLDRLLELDRWPALFVCGANHIDGFSALLKSRGLSVQISERDWTASG